MLRTLADIWPEERRSALSGFLALFGILAGHTLLETARDALFLSRLPASQLPGVYLALALIAVGLSQIPALNRMGGAYGLSTLLFACAGITFGFWLLGSWRNPWCLRALYIWSGLVGTLTALQFWVVMGDTYTVTQAKRLYRFIATGSLLGAIAGSALARVLANALPAQTLVLAAAFCFAVTGIGPALLLRASAGPPRTKSREAAAPRLGMSLGVMGAHPYVKGLAGLVLVSTVALTLCDYIFKSAVAQNVEPSQLGEFFASFYMVLNMLALAVQLFLMGWLMRVAGLHRMLWLLPGLLFVGSAGCAFGGGLLAALIMKGADGSLRHSVHRTSTELLSLPIPDAMRYHAKPLIDVVGQRGGQAIASLVILGEVGLHRGDSVISAATAVLCLVWITIAVSLRPHYVELFRNALREGSMRDRVELPDLDLGSLETLFASLNSGDDAEVIAAMELLSQEGRGRLIPALILYHPSQAVVLHALDLFERSGRTDFVPVADRLLTHYDHEVRAAALRARSTVAPDEAVLRVGFADASPLVRATALAGLVAGGWISDAAQATLDELLESGNSAAQIALLQAIRRRPAPVFEAVLLTLAQHADEEVQRGVAQAMGAVRSDSFLPALLPLLIPHEVRSAARAAFLAFGEPALRFLESSLVEHDLPHELRRHLPRTISLFPAAQAAAILLRRMLDEPDGMVRFKILRGLGRIAAEHPEVGLDRATVTTAIERTLEAAFRLVHWRDVLLRGAADDPRRATPGHELLTGLLRDKEVHATERVFRLLGLLHRHEDFKRIHRGLRSSNAKVQASSRELLENLVRAPLRAPVLALVDPGPAEQRLLLAGAYYRVGALGYEPLLAVLLEQPGESLSSIAAYHVGELGLTSFRERLQKFRPEAGFFVGRVVEHALRLLNAPEELALPTEARAVGSIERLLYLRRFPVIAGLPAQDMAVVAEYAVERSFAAGETLLREGEPVGAIYMVVEGVVDVHRQGRSLGLARPGAGVGGLSFLARDPGGISAVAVEETLALELDADTLLEIFEDHFSVLHFLLRDTCRDLIKLWQRPETVWPMPIPMPAPNMPREMDLVERIFLLRRSPIFHDASINALAELSRGLAEIRFDAGVRLWEIGEPSGVIQLLVRGEVTIDCPNRPPFQVGPGTPLGGLEGLGEVPRWYAATTATPVVALHASSEGLLDVFEDNFDMAFAYLSHMAAWLGAGLEQLHRRDPNPTDFYALGRTPS